MVQIDGVGVVDVVVDVVVGAGALVVVVVVVVVGAGVVAGAGVVVGGEVVEDGGEVTTPVHWPGGRQRELPLDQTPQTQPSVQTAGFAAQTLLPHWA